MRADMAQVVTERPRTRSGDGYRDVREHDVAHRDLERLADLPVKEGMRHPYGYESKEQTDLLGPLHSFLINSVGRPWDKVYSEICEHISPSSTIQIHILGHVDQFIETKTALGEDGKVYRLEHGYRTWRGMALSEYPGELYVHPITGIVRRVPEARAPWKHRKAEEATFKVLGRERELHQVDGVWYWAVFATAQRRSMFDAVRGETWTAYPTDFFTGDQTKVGERYRAGKRQASGRDLRKAGLQNDAPKRRLRRVPRRVRPALTRLT